MWAHTQIPLSNVDATVQCAASGRVHGVPVVRLGHSLPILRLCFLISSAAVLTVQSARTILLRVTHCHLGGNAGVGAPRPASLLGVTSYSPSSPRRPQNPATMAVLHVGLRTKLPGLQILFIFEKQQKTQKKATAEGAKTEAFRTWRGLAWGWGC